MRIKSIEGLRGIAVLAVILNHFFEPLLESGYLGVDVFFVISGFVITKQIRNAYYASWREFIGSFIARRIKRLLPALWLCLTITSLCFFLVATRPGAEVFKTAATAFVGLSNIYLHKISANYFSLDTRLNPFTHTWSLGVEEQFYLFFPFFLGVAGLVSIGTRQQQKSTTLPLLLALLSLGLWFYAGSRSALAQYYLLPCRMWELALGSYFYLNYEAGKTRFLAKDTIALVASASLLACFLAPSGLWPQATTLACVVSTCLLLCAITADGIAYRFYTFRFLTIVGALSYSLYLWHWSILVLGRWTFGESIFARVLYLLIAIVLSTISYYAVEQPIRNVRTDKNLLVITVGLVVAIATAFVLAWYLPSKASRNNNLLANLFGIQAVPPATENECHGKQNIAIAKLKDPFSHCLDAVRTVVKPYVVYMVGDSHAARLYWTVLQSIEGSAYQLRFLNLGDDFPFALINGASGGSLTLNYVKAHAKPGDVVIVAFHRGHFNPQRDKHIPLSETPLPNQEMQNFTHGMSSYLEAFEKAGVQMLLIRDTPLMQVISTSPACALQLKLFSESICRVGRLQDVHTRRRQDYVFDQLHSSHSNVQIWDPAPTMYGDRNWLEVVDDLGNYVMLDWNHITDYQAERLVPSFKPFVSDVLRQQQSGNSSLERLIGK